MAAALILYMTFGVEIDHSHICKVRMKCSLQFNNYKLSEVMSDKFNADRICTSAMTSSQKQNYYCYFNNNNNNNNNNKRKR